MHTRAGKRGRAATIGLLIALVAAVLFEAAPASAANNAPADACRPYASGVRIANTVLAPWMFPAPDPAIVVGDPDADDYPLVPARFPDETGLWASVGIRGIGLEEAAADSPVHPAIPAALSPQRIDPTVSDSVARLYCGLLERKAELHEVDYWVRRYRNGLPLSSIAEAFTTSTEFVHRYGDPTDEDLVTLLYRAVLGREPAPGDVQRFVEMLQDGELTRGSLVVMFTDSPEFVEMTGTASPEKPALPYPAVGSGRRIIYANREARVWFVEATGELAKTHQVSGRRGVPRPGRYNVYSKSRYAWAPYDGITMEYMVRFAREEWPYGFHSIPIHRNRTPLQTKEQLGTLRSGGCVRQDFDDAAFTFAWADVGTRVIVIP